MSLIKNKLLLLIRKYCFKVFSWSVFTETLCILSDFQIKSWVDFGTLLGFVRSKNFIRNDFDIDIGVVNVSRAEITKELEGKGYKLVDTIYSKQGHFTLGFIRKGVLVDIYGYIFNNDGNVECIIKVGEKFIALENSLSGIETYKISGKKIFVPTQKEQWLSRIYGSGYVAPDPNYSGSLNVKGEIDEKDVTHTYLNRAMLF